MTGVLTEVRDRLVEEIDGIGDLHVERIVLGLGYSGVKIGTGHAGVCNSMISESSPDCCQVLLNAGSLAGRPATEFLEMIDSWDFIERVMGVSTVNALSQIVFDAEPDRYDLEKRNLIEVIETEPEDTVAMVGHIKPFEKAFRSKAKKLYILERSAHKEDGVLPDTACEEIIPRANIVVITGSALANGTLDRLVELAEGARTVALVGPTVSCLPDPLFERGVDYAGGIMIRDADKAMQILMEGGGTPQLKQAGEFVTFKAPQR